MSCVIFDIDNCVADDGHRIRLIDHSLAGAERWAAYHDACFLDDPHHDDVLRLHSKHTIAFVTGRPEAVRLKTLRWIKKHFPYLDDQNTVLLMRSDEHSVLNSVELKRKWLQWLRDKGCDVIGAYDDREDIVSMYKQQGVHNAQVLRIHDDMSPHGDIEPAASPDIDSLAQLRPTHAQPARLTTADAILRAAAATFEERNAGYKDNYKMVAPIIRALFPAGVPPELVADDRWHLFELTIVKLTRFAVSGLGHNDSARDAAVYLAMIEAINHERQTP